MHPKTPKQKLLNRLSHAQLKLLVERLNLGAEIPRNQQRDQLLLRLSRLKRVSIEHVVAMLSESALRKACAELGLDKNAKHKQLALQILARFGRMSRLSEIPAS